jgi:ubiquinol-cytochrome c reductase iron-sulfur subunit
VKYRRQWLLGACVLGAGVGIGRYAALRPRPPEGTPMAVDISALTPGRLKILDWEGRTLWLLRRSPEQVAALAEREAELIDPASEHSLQPDGCRNRHRSLRPELFVAIGQCTHQGCPPQLRAGDGVHGEFLCPCHSSKFDLAGRVFRSGPALSNLVVPQYHFDGDSSVVIGSA